MKNQLLLIIFILCNVYLSNSQEENVLFIGNSYTFIHDIPSMLYEVASSTGDELFVDSKTTGGSNFEFHANNQEVTDKINSENWDFVVLQGQSIEVALTGIYFWFNVVPYANQLVETIRSNNSCSQPVFYNTWGREFGLSGSTCTSYPWVCTYEDMDDELAQNYRTLADTNDAIIAPVGPVWRYIRDNSLPIDLYHPDNSHQSLEGAYASACTFYTVILRKDPTLITYDAGIDPLIASQIRNAVKIVVFDQLELWKVDEFDPISDFSFTENSGVLTFINNSSNALAYAWDFGDGNTSTDENPIHSYSENGDYDVELLVTKCGVSNIYTETISVNSLSVKENEINALKLFPNPLNNEINISGLNFETIQSIYLYDLFGKKLRVETKIDTAKIDVSKLATGTYFIEFTTKTGSKEIRKVVKK